MIGVAVEARAPTALALQRVPRFRLRSSRVTGHVPRLAISHLYDMALIRT
jgi:hypothetical protein